jgi:hypothetical protein
MKRSRWLLLAPVLAGGALLCPSGPTVRSLAQDAAATSPVGSAAFVGSKKCMKCHLKEHRSWAQTKMGKALETLAPNAALEAKRKAGLDPAVDYRRDARCVRCHTVGAGHEGGFDPAVHIAADPDQRGGVGCESCHGAGGLYLAEGLHDRSYKGKQEERRAALIARGYQATPDEASCRSCHNEESPTFKPFDYEQRKHDGLHERTD